MPTDLQTEHVAVCKVRVDGADLPDEARADLLSARVLDDLDHPSSFALCFNNWDPKKIEVKWSDDDLFNVGKQVDVSLGPLGKPNCLIAGEITGVELAVSPRHSLQLVVRGYDRAHRFQRGRQTRSFAGVKDSEIASRMASEYGLEAEVETTSETFAYLLQHRQSDAAFLRERARRIGYEVFVREKTLYFRARKNDASSNAVLSENTGLLEFYPRLSSMQRASSVELRSWDPASKEAWVGKATSSDESVLMGGETLGLEGTRKAFGETCLLTNGAPAASQADADQRALGELKRAALSYVTAEGVSIGRPELRAGNVVEVQGMGKRFSGLYYLTSTVHTFLPAKGYRTSFEARRSAV